MNKAKGFCNLICNQLNIKNIVWDVGILADNIPLTINYNQEDNKFTSLLEEEKSKRQLTQKVMGDIILNILQK